MKDIEMQQVVLSPTSSKVEFLKEEVVQVQDILNANISQVLDNMDQTEDLQEKSKDMSRFSKEFSVRAKEAKRKLYWKSKKLSLIIFSIVGGVGGYTLYELFN